MRRERMLIEGEEVKIQERDNKQIAEEGEARTATEGNLHDERGQEDDTQEHDHTSTLVIAEAASKTTPTVGDGGMSTTRRTKGRSPAGVVGTHNLPVNVSHIENNGSSARRQKRSMGGYRREMKKSLVAMRRKRGEKTLSGKTHEKKSLTIGFMDNRKLI